VFSELVQTEEMLSRCLFHQEEGILKNVQKVCLYSENALKRHNGKGAAPGRATAGLEVASGVSLSRNGAAEPAWARF
jgi:hypothetical protein